MDSPAGLAHKIQYWGPPKMPFFYPLASVFWGGFHKANNRKIQDHSSSVDTSLIAIYRFAVLFAR